MDTLFIVIVSAICGLFAALGIFGTLGFALAAILADEWDRSRYVGACMFSLIVLLAVAAVFYFFAMSLG